MREQGPKQVILDQLRLFEDSPSDLVALIRKDGGFVRSVKYKARLPHGAKTATVRFLKERSIPGYQVHAITFEDVAGITWRLFCLVVQDSTGNWYIEGCSGIAGNTPMSHPFNPHSHPALSGDLGDHFFYAGGSVIDDTRLGVVRVRLLSDEGLIAEDTVEDDVCVFVSNQNVRMPVRFELYNQAGELIGSGRVSFYL